MKLKWIVSAKWDLTFFTGSVLLTYLYYGSYKLLLNLPESSFFHQYAAVIVTLSFYSLFDHPHIFQTFSRTHADSTEFARRRRLYTYGILGVLALGYAIQLFHFNDRFETFLNIYGIWHILRQNSGFLRLYRKRGEEYSPLDSYLDYTLLYGSVAIFLLIRIFVKSKAVQSDLNLESYASWFPQWESVPEFLHKLFFLFLIVYALRQLYLFMKGEMNLPKILFLTAIVGTYYFTYVFSDPPFGLLVVLDTVYHDVQYQGWIIHFQKQRLTSSWKKWFLASISYGLVYAGLAIFSFQSAIGSWFLPPFLMLVLFHYFIDGRIWRFSQNPELRRIYNF